MKSTGFCPAFWAYIRPKKALPEPSKNAFDSTPRSSSKTSLSCAILSDKSRSNRPPTGHRNCLQVAGARSLVETLLLECNNHFLHVQIWPTSDSQRTCILRSSGSAR